MDAEKKESGRFSEFWLAHGSVIPKNVIALGYAAVARRDSFRKPHGYHAQCRYGPGHQQSHRCRVWLRRREVHGNCRRCFYRRGYGWASHEKLVPRVEGLRVGPSQDPQSDYGPLVTAQHRDKVKGYINMGIEEGATLAVDGREFSLQRYEDGFFFGASLFDNVTAGMQFYREEIFGIVLQVICAPNFEGAIALPTAMTPATVPPSTSATATPPANLPRGWGVCMVGVNVSISVPLAYYSFGGWKRSAFGDMNRQGMDGTRFYTKLKTDASRWPSGVKEGFDLFIPTMK